MIEKIFDTLVISAKGEDHDAIRNVLMTCPFQILQDIEELLSRISNSLHSEMKARRQSCREGAK